MSSRKVISCVGKIINYLRANNVQFVQQKRYINCRSNNNILMFDFYLPRFDCAINFITQSVEHQIKIDYCAVNKISLIHVKYNENIVNKLNKHFAKQYFNK